VLIIGQKSLLIELKTMNIKFGIIGCGNIGLRHAKHIYEHKEGTLANIYDLNFSRSSVISKEYSCRASEKFDDFLSSDLDIVNICTPNGLHAEHAIKCMNAGKHVLVEKPMALSSADCEKMIHTSLRTNKQLFVVKQNRHNPPVVALKEKIDNNQLGRIYSVIINCFWNRNENYYKSSSWKGSKDLDGGTLFTQFSHFIDILYYLFGDIKEVFGQIKNVSHDGLIEFEDTGFFNFQLENNSLGSLNYTTSAYKKNMEGSILVFAENATIKIGGQYLNTVEYQSLKGDKIILNNKSNKANDYGSYQGSMSNHDLVINNVINTLNGRESIMTNALEGMKVVNIIERMYASTKA